MDAPKLRLQGNVQSLFEQLDLRARKLRCLADLVGECLTNDIERVGGDSAPARRLPMVEGSRVQDLSLIVVDEADRLIEQLEASRVFYSKIEVATAEPETCPMVAVISAYRVAEDEYAAAKLALAGDATDEEQQALYDRVIEPARSPLFEPPAIGSDAGAAAAMRIVLEDDEIGGIARSMVEAVSTYLDGRAAR